MMQLNFANGSKVIILH